VQHRLPIRFFLLFLVSSAIFWSIPASARLFPPCQGITCSQDYTDSIRYGCSDPIGGQYREETWSLSQGDERYVESVRADQGILTWIARYKNAGEDYFTYQVHFRIYDPGRGIWKGDSWGPFAGYRTAVAQHQVKDGVVAWTAFRAMGPSIHDWGENQVYYVTYDPQLGSWSHSKQLWQLVQETPEILQVRNGVVAWNMVNKKVYCSIYDHELHLWMEDDLNLAYVGGADPRSMSIPGDLARIVYLKGDQWWGYEYNPYTHRWFNLGYGTALGYPFRRVFFVAQPASGMVPFRVWFWDCSTAMDGLPNPSAWDWLLFDGVSPPVRSPDRSPSFQYTIPGLWYVESDVNYASGFYIYTATGQIDAQVSTPPTGGININGGAAYTTSTNVTLNLDHSSTATEMCFRASPGLVWWTPWEPVAATKDWTLSSMHLIGETPDGPQSISVKYRDQYGIESRVSTASITLDVTPPAVFLTLNSGAATTQSPSVRVQWSGSDAMGLTQMSYMTLNQGDSFSAWSPPIYFNPPTLAYHPATSTIRFNANPGRKTVIVRFIDVAGNITHAQASIQLKQASLSFLPLLLWN
jgi:hypothetical protein